MIQLRTHRQDRDNTILEQGERVAKVQEDQWVVGVTWWMHNNLHNLCSMRKTNDQIFGWACECGYATKV